MKKFTFPILLSLLICFSCNETDDPKMVCGSTDPLNDLSWLKAVKEAYAYGELSEYNYIGQASYGGENVFYLASCCPACNWALVSYDCSGNLIEGDHSLEDLDNKKVIWNAENSKCMFNQKSQIAGMI